MRIENEDELALRVLAANYSAARERRAAVRERMLALPAGQAPPEPMCGQLRSASAAESHAALVLARVLERIIREGA